MLSLVAVALLATGRVEGATISIGTRVSLSPTTFALPIDIMDPAGVDAWAFGLTYDPTDVQVNIGCDPLSGDVYCSFLTGPVTEGDFFASGAPFNLLNPGFVALDASTLLQTGSLFGVNGAFGGSPPLPSGTGTIAFVEFSIIGTGTTPITISPQELTTVPEPGSLALLTTGLLVAGRRKRRTTVRSKR